MNVAGEEPRISYCLVPTNTLIWKDFVIAVTELSTKPQVCYLLAPRPMGVPGPVVPTVCT